MGLSRQEYWGGLPCPPPEYLPHPGIKWVWVSLVAQSLKNLPANAGDARDAGHQGSILGSGRSPGEGHGKPHQYSCLENPMDEVSWRATVHRVVISQTQLKKLSMHAGKHCIPDQFYHFCLFA